MDIYVSTLLGLPQMLSDDDIDQEYPMEVDGDYITTEGITQPPSNYTPLMAGCNAHTRLSNIILKVVKYIYPAKLDGRIASCSTTGHRSVAAARTVSLRSTVIIS